MLTIDCFFVFSALMVVAALKANSIVMLIAGFAIGCMGYGGITCANSAHISATFGQKNYPRIFPIINTNLLIASFGSTIDGSLLDATDTYMSISFMMLFLAMAGIILTLILKRAGRKNS